MCTSYTQIHRFDVFINRIFKCCIHTSPLQLMKRESTSDHHNLPSMIHYHKFISQHDARDALLSSTERGTRWVDISRATQHLSCSLLFAHVCCVVCWLRVAVLERARAGGQHMSRLMTAPVCRHHSTSSPLRSVLADNNCGRSVLMSMRYLSTLFERGIIICTCICAC